MPKGIRLHTFSDTTKRKDMTNTKVYKGVFPDNSLAINYLPADYVDVFSCIVSKKQEITSDELLVNLWTDQPKWLKLLFNLRHILVKPLGLKAENVSKKEDLEGFTNCIRSGGTYGIVSVPSKSSNETIMQIKNKHLDCTISIHIRDNENNKQLISAITLVHFHNKLGVKYFQVIRPFHKLIVRKGLERIINRK
jgi:hypothetical protein